MTYRAAGSALIAVMIVALASICSPAGVATAAAKPKPKPKHKGKPDLVITNVELRGSPSDGPAGKPPVVILESDGSGHFGLSYTIKNVGRGPAHTSRVAVKIASTRVEKVGPIAPGKAKTVDREYSDFRFTMGNYKLTVCADSSGQIKESKESNNCSPPVSFATIPRRWNTPQFIGGFHSTSGGDGEAKGDGLSFDYYGLGTETGTTVFYYQARGGVTETLGGTSGNCTVTGEGSVGHDLWGGLNTGFLEITTDFAGYFAKVEDPNSMVTGMASCPDPTLNFPIQDAILPLQTVGSEGTFYNPMSSKSTILPGSFLYAGGAGEDVYGSWQFKAALP
jgi:CARDB